MSNSHSTADGIWLGICNCPYPGVSLSPELIKVILENEKVLIRENVPERRCKNAGDLFNKILTNFGFPNWPKIHCRDMHFLARDEGIWQLGIESWNINEESFVS